MTGCSPSPDLHDRSGTDLCMTVTVLVTLCSMSFSRRSQGLRLTWRGTNPPLQDLVTLIVTSEAG
jgi:hypothetical protein